MNTITARELLVPIDLYPWATPQTTIAQAIEQLESTQIVFAGRTSMPRVLLVLGDDQELIGKVRRRDLLRGLEPQFGGELAQFHPEATLTHEVDPNLSSLLAGIDPDRLAKDLEKPIGELVRPVKGSVDIDDPLMNVVRELVGKDTHLAVVLDEHEVVGVVRTVDVLRVWRRAS